MVMYNSLPLGLSECMQWYNFPPFLKDPYRDLGNNQSFFKQSFFVSTCKLLHPQIMKKKTIFVIGFWCCFVPLYYWLFGIQGRSCGLVKKKSNLVNKMTNKIEKPA